MNSRLAGILTLVFLTVGNCLAQDLRNNCSRPMEAPGSNSFLGAVDLAKLYLARAAGETEKNVGAWLLGASH
jgi:hypothetical protein